ncbi:MAG: hypothetical protein ACK2UQ_01905 [Anaerolineae bacterium]
MPFDGMPQPWLWGYFLPVGLLLLTWGGLPPHKARRVTPVAALALALAVVGYWAVGFAFHLGGAQAVRPDDSSLSGLKVLFPLVPRDVGWGFVGLSGFFLSGPEITSAVLELFLAYLPLMASAVLLVTLALVDTRRWLMVTAGALAGTLVFPVAACWMWGGGWLAHLGDTLGLGHGFVDFGGGALVLWLPGALALGILLFQPRHTPEDPPTPPPAYFPLLANLGVLLMGIGWIGWTLSAPFHTSGATWDWNRAAFSALLGMAGATLTSQLYAWLVTGDLESLLAARGLAAGWGAALAAAPFVPPWAALVIGLLGGLLFSFILYLTNVVLRLRDAAATVALGLVGGLWGLLSVALFADGQAGQGWNGISGNGGVIGVFFGGGAGQLTAQLVGIVAVGVWGLLWGGLLGLIANLHLFRRKLAPVVEAVTSSEMVWPPEVASSSSDILSAEEGEPVLPEAIPEEVSETASDTEDKDLGTNSQESVLT